MNSSDAASQKRSLRTRYRALRQTLDSGTRAGFDQEIRQHLASRLQHQAGLTAAAFLAFDGEPDIEVTLLEFRDGGLQIALPVLESESPPSISLRTWTDEVSLRPNRYGIREPTEGDPISLDQIDVLLMPLVSFDSKGTRLGVGGGYYDRLLATNAHQSMPYRVGVAYSLQQAASIPRENWDIPLHAILTEDGWFSFPL